MDGYAGCRTGTGAHAHNPEIIFMNTDTHPIVSVEQCTAGYENQIVWHNATFSIRKGEFVAVLGPNGSGKTTLFRLLLGLHEPLEGSVRVLGTKPERGNPKIGYVPQNHPISSEINVEVLELVRLGVDGTRWGFHLLCKGDRAIAREALRAAGAEGLAHRSLGTLSGGELQRVFLAEALVGKPDLLLLDEPTSNLDIRRQGELVELVKGIVTERGITAILIAHDINPLLPALNRIIYIANGKVATGTPEEVLNSDTLSALYGIPIEVMKNAAGRIAVLGGESLHHHHRHDQEPQEHHHE